VRARVRLGGQSLCSLKHAAASEAGSIKRRTRCSVHWERAVLSCIELVACSCIYGCPQL
jgi:hypothetical protein